MRLNEVVYSDAKPVEGYGPGFFRIGGEVYKGPVIAGDSGVSPWAGFDDHAPLLALAGKIDILFIGTGTESSPAAARTYNVLLSEGRRIALALIPV